MYHTDTIDRNSTQPSRSAHYFAVGADTMHAACDLGINEAVTFLALARGSAADDISTSWSAQAASKRLGMRWTTAKKAINRLNEADLLVYTRGGTKPTYQLAKQGSTTILPNTLVDGAKGELSPLRRLRVRQDPMLVRLLIDFYGHQNLRDDGGIGTDTAYADYKVRERLGQSGDYVAWGFADCGWYGTGKSVMTPHAQAVARGKTSYQPFFDRMQALEDEGLIEQVDYVLDGPEGEPLFPLRYGSDIAAEKAVANACHDAALAILGDAAYRWDKFDEDHSDDITRLVCVPSRLAHVTIRSVYRLRYRPHTPGVRGWYGADVAACEAYTRDFQHIIAGDIGRSHAFGLGRKDAQEEELHEKVA